MKIVVLYIVMLYSLIDVTSILEEHIIFNFKLGLRISPEDGSDTVL
jgi:hypothetical protein